MLNEAEIVEVKQGPYAGDSDKTRFKAISESEVRYKWRIYLMQLVIFMI